MHLHGIIYGKRIELEEETDLPSGSSVIVDIRLKSLSVEEKQRLTDALCGAWANDPSLKTIFEEIERHRALDCF